MSAIPLTVFLSLALAGLFTVLFWREQRRPHLGGPERDSLLPLADETPRPVRRDGPASPASPAVRPLAPAEAHHHVAGGCGCGEGGCGRHHAPHGCRCREAAGAGRTLRLAPARR